MIFGFQFTYTDKTTLSNIIKLSDQMEISLRENAVYYSINSATNGLNETVTYQKFKSKDIMDTIDKELKKIYNFTHQA